MKFRAEQQIESITLSDYETLYFDETFNEALCEHVRLSRRVRKHDHDGGHLVREVTVSPDREIPAPMAKILGASRFEYTECLEYDMGQYRATWKVIPSLMPEKVDCHGTLEFKEADGGVLRIVQGHVKVKVFGIGGVIERFIVADVERSYEKASQFANRWIAERQRGSA